MSHFWSVKFEIVLVKHLKTKVTTLKCGNTHWGPGWVFGQNSAFVLWLLFFSRTQKFTNIQILNLKRKTKFVEFKTSMWQTSQAFLRVCDIVFLKIWKTVITPLNGIVWFFHLFDIILAYRELWLSQHLFFQIIIFSFVTVVTDCTRAKYYFRVLVRFFA